MEYGKEDLMEAKKLEVWEWGDMGTEESKKSGRELHNFGIMQWVTESNEFHREVGASQSNKTSISNPADYIFDGERLVGLAQAHRVGDDAAIAMPGLRMAPHDGVLLKS